MAFAIVQSGKGIKSFYEEFFPMWAKDDERDSESAGKAKVKRFGSRRQAFREYVKMDVNGEN